MNDIHLTRVSLVLKPCHLLFVHSTSTFEDCIQVQCSTDRELILTREKVVQLLPVTVPGGRGPSYQQARQQPVDRIPRSIFILPAIHLDRTSDLPTAAFSETCHFTRQVHVKWMKPQYTHFVIDSLFVGGRTTHVAASVSFSTSYHLLVITILVQFALQGFISRQASQASK